MSERHDEVEPDVASVVAEAVGAFGGETVRVLQTDHVDGQRSWDAALIGQHTCFDPARGGAVTALEFRTGERIELAASEVSAATFGRQFGDAHESLTVMTAAARRPCRTSGRRTATTTCTSATSARPGLRAPPPSSRSLAVSRASGATSRVGL
jgi:hypothetical protein